jgi:hypothetical protein
LNNNAPLILALLEQLIEAWGINQTANDIGSDVQKIRLLSQTCDELNTQGQPPPEHIRGFYHEVFLCDKFSADKGSGD